MLPPPLQTYRSEWTSGDEMNSTHRWPRRRPCFASAPFTTCISTPPRILCQMEYWMFENQSHQPSFGLESNGQP